MFVKHRRGGFVSALGGASTAPTPVTSIRGLNPQTPVLEEPQDTFALSVRTQLSAYRFFGHRANHLLDVYVQ